jgi:homocysteine S-methyltransferase
VAGAIGPLGIRIEPWGKMSIDEARALFREQAQALIDGGVDVMILETFFDLNEIHAAMRGVRDVTDKPLVVQISVEDNGNSLEGTPPEVFAKVPLTEYADVLGLNCSVGPQTMLDAIERIANLTSKSWLRSRRGPAKKHRGTKHLFMLAGIHGFVRQEVCTAWSQNRWRMCGTTPDHIKAIRSAVQILALAKRTDQNPWRPWEPWRHRRRDRWKRNLARRKAGERTIHQDRGNDSACRA